MDTKGTALYLACRNGIAFDAKRNKHLVMRGGLPHEEADTLTEALAYFNPRLLDAVSTQSPTADVSTQSPIEDDE